MPACKVLVGSPQCATADFIAVRPPYQAKSQTAGNTPAIQKEVMAPSAEELREKGELEVDEGGRTAGKPTNGDYLVRLNGRLHVNGNDDETCERGVDIIQRGGGGGELTVPYMNGSTPPIHKFSPPAFTSLIDLCRDITRLQLGSEREEFDPREAEEDLRTAELADEEGEDFILLEEDKKEKIKRTSSLKSARTSGGQKKIVRFADVLGLDLADVHTFLDEVPRIPKSAFKDLKNVDFSPVGSPKETFRHHHHHQEQRTLIPLFVQPGSQPGFQERLAKKKVILENAYVSNTLGLFIRGTVRVVNLDFNKHVAIRYSSDKWVSFTEIQATYVDSAHDGFSDRFGFTIPIFSMVIGNRLEFALKYSVLGEDFWDNNEGANYTFQCVPEGPPRHVTSAYVPSSIALETWGSFY